MPRGVDGGGRVGRGVPLGRVPREPALLRQRPPPRRRLPLLRALSALVNRLMYCVHRDRVLVANSLALLLAFTGATLEPGLDYRAETYAIRRGVRGYNKDFVVRH